MLCGELHHNRIGNAAITNLQGRAVVNHVRHIFADGFLYRTDFGQTDLAARIRDAALELSREKDLWHSPPADALFLHRKLGGLYLLAVKLKARVNVQSLIKGFV